MYLIYCGHMQFFYTTRKGLWHSCLFDELPGGTYQLHSHGPVEQHEKKSPPFRRTTLNSMRAGIIGDKALQHVKHEFDRIHKAHPQKPKKTKPKCQQKQQCQLNVEIHGLPVRRPQKHSIKCPMCLDVFQLVKDLNVHIKERHPKFCYKCNYCTKKFQNYASKYKHERKHSVPSHVCAECHKRFFFNKDLQVHLCVHSGQGTFPCTNCPNKYNTRTAMDTHCIVHQNKKFTCDKCSTFYTNTLPNLHQHERGKHG